MTTGEKKGRLIGVTIQENVCTILLALLYQLQGDTVIARWWYSYTFCSDSSCLEYVIELQEAREMPIQFKPRIRKQNCLLVKKKKKKSLDQKAMWEEE